MTLSRRAEKREARRTAQWQADLRWLMAHAQGRRIVQNLIARSGIEHTTAFTGNSGTFYQLGTQDFMRKWCHELRAVALADFRRMEDEALAAAPPAATTSLDDDEADADDPAA